MAGYTEAELKGRGVKVGGMLYTETTDGVAALAGQVYDTRLGKDQQTINEELAERAGTEACSDEEVVAVWAAAGTGDGAATAAKATAFGLKRVERVTRL